MELLEKAILEKGKVLPGNVLKVGSFFNQQIDTELLMALGEDVFNHYKNKKVDKIFTVEASGIALAVVIATYFKCNVVFAKKSKSNNVDGEVYSSTCYSYTHKTENKLICPKDYLSKGENVLIVDDFLANGEALSALSDIVKQAGAKIVGCAIGIEKGFQGAREKLKDLEIYSLAIIDKMDENGITFRK